MTVTVYFDAKRKPAPGRWVVVTKAESSVKVEAFPCEVTARAYAEGVTR